MADQPNFPVIAQGLQLFTTEIAKFQNLPAAAVSAQQMTDLTTTIQDIRQTMIDMRTDLTGLRTDLTSVRTTVDGISTTLDNVQRDGLAIRRIVDRINTSLQAS